jgi:hypothetical protein
MHGAQRGKINILGGHSIGHSKQKSVHVHMSFSERFRRQLFHCSVDLHRMTFIKNSFIGLWSFAYWKRQSDWHGKLTGAFLLTIHCECAKKCNKFMNSRVHHCTSTTYIFVNISWDVRMDLYGKLETSEKLTVVTNLNILHCNEYEETE